MARPSKYDPLITPVLARALAREGYTDEEIAARLDPPVSVATLSRWKNEHLEFREALNDGKAIVDARVEDSLLQRAVGFTCTDTRLEAKADEFGRPQKGGRVIKTTRHLPPDVTACIYWLKNRKPGQWRDRHDLLPEANKEALQAWLHSVKLTDAELTEMFGSDDEDSEEE
ncbi:MAG: hypothetical protein U1E29_11170 [Coriobacteriia bacterium]|nr:hypothetical protein [Coriobacteriia bacterium]